MRFPAHLRSLLVLALLISLLSACAPGAASTPVVPTPALAQPTPTLTTVSPTSAPPTPKLTETLAPTATVVTVPPPLIQAFNMLDASTGWAVGEQGFFRTTDGGVSWQDVTPPEAIGSQGPWSQFFLDAQNAWVAKPDAMSPDKGQIFVTADGGKTWKLSNTPFGGAAFSFFDAKNGFALVGLGAGAGSEAIAILKTQDGGMTWTELFRHDPQKTAAPGEIPFSGIKSGITFRDATHGWVTGSIPMDNNAYLYYTEDGGVTFTQQTLTLPPEIKSAMMPLDPPVFFNQKDGVLPAALYRDVPYREFYVTHDGGATWTPTRPVPSNGAFSIASASDFIVFDGANLYQSEDAGQSWSQVAPNVNLKDMVGTIDFVDHKTGWVTSMDATGKSGFYRTVNAGVTWETLSK